MVVYVESNFVLEVAFLHEDHDSCSALLELARAGAIELVIPAFSIGEPYEASVRRWLRRNELNRQLTDEIRELARSKPYHDAAGAFQELATLLVKSGEDEKQRLNDTLDEVLKVAAIIRRFVKSCVKECRHLSWLSGCA